MWQTPSGSSSSDPPWRKWCNRVTGSADVGCGSAVLGLLCLQAGAGHVDAVDSTAAIEIARQSLTRAGWGDKASFIHGKSFQVDLPEAGGRRHLRPCRLLRL